MAKKNPGRKPGPLVPQPHGGAILQGPTPAESHVPGPGRPKNWVIQSFKEGLAEAQEVLRAKLKAGTLDDKDIISFANLQAKYTTPVPKEIVDEGFLRELAEVVASVLMTHPDGEDLLRQINEGWTPIVGSRM